MKKLLAIFLALSMCLLPLLGMAEGFQANVRAELNIPAEDDLMSTLNQLVSALSIQLKGTDNVFALNVNLQDDTLLEGAATLDGDKLIVTSPLLGSTALSLPMDQVLPNPDALADSLSDVNLDHTMEVLSTALQTVMATATVEPAEALPYSGATGYTCMTATVSQATILEIVSALKEDLKSVQLPAELFDAVATVNGTPVPTEDLIPQSLDALAGSIGENGAELKLYMDEEGNPAAGELKVDFQDPDSKQAVAVMNACLYPTEKGLFIAYTVDPEGEGNTVGASIDMDMYSDPGLVKAEVTVYEEDDASVRTILLKELISAAASENGLHEEVELLTADENGTLATTAFIVVDGKEDESGVHLVFSYAPDAASNPFVTVYCDASDLEGELAAPEYGNVLDATTLSEEDTQTLLNLVYANIMTPLTKLLTAFPELQPLLGM